MAIRNGDSGPNSLRGTNKSDELYGRGGNDTLDAVSIQPGTAFDFVDGGAGVDVLNIDATSETQSLTLNSGATNFELRSLSGRFMLDAFSIERINFAGGSADDFIWTGSRGGSVSGRGGIDLWTADLSQLTGDVFFDLRRPDNTISEIQLTTNTIERINLTTGSGDDRIIGFSQGDTIDGGDGNDSIDAGERPAAGPAVDIVVGGDGTDTLLVVALNETQSVRLLFGADSLYAVRSDSGNFAVDAFEFERVEFRGGHGDDLIQTGDRGAFVFGGGGVDRWVADLSDLTSRVDIDLNQGHFSIPAADLDVRAIDGITLTTGSGNDRIVTVSSSSPGRTQHTDFIDTGAGNDFIDVGKHLAGSFDVEVVDGGLGNDVLHVDAHGESTAVQLSFGANPRYAVRSTSGNYAIDAHNVERIDITTGGGDDVLSANDNNDTIDSRHGDDFINGGAGNDSIDAGPGADTIIGGLGSDFIDDGGDSGNPIGNLLIYNSVAESSVAAPDRLFDFTAPGRDEIDLSGIDANGGAAGNGTFIFIDNDAFSGQAGELRSLAGRLDGDVNGDGAVDFRIVLLNNAIVDAGALIL